MSSRTRNVQDAKIIQLQGRYGSFKSSSKKLDEKISKKPNVSIKNPVSILKYLLRILASIVYLILLLSVLIINIVVSFFVALFQQDYIRWNKLILDKLDAIKAWLKLKEVII